MTELSREQDILGVENITIRLESARSGYRLDYPGSCNMQREAACVDVIALAQCCLALREKLAAVKQQLTEAQARIAELMQADMEGKPWKRMGEQ